MQSYLSIAALLLITLLAVTLYSWVDRTLDYGYYVDTVQEIRAVNIDLFDYLATIPFDSRTDTTKYSPFVTPSLASELTSPGGFGGSCTPINPSLRPGDPGYVAPTCADLDDYHGKTINRSLSWFDLETRIEVVYVDLYNPSSEPGIQTFAKEVRLYSSSPYLTKIAPGLTEMVMKRVYTYYHKQSPP